MRNGATHGRNVGVSAVKSGFGVGRGDALHDFPVFVSLSFPTESGHTYTVLYKSSLTSSIWTTVGTISGNGAVTNVTESLTGTQGYYTVTMQ